jgi:serine/threonine protein kinase
MSDLEGRMLGQYKVEKLIGKGGMATVYLGRQPSVGRTVAIKVLPTHFMHEETFIKRFQREVRAIARMQHPHILPVHDYGEEGGTPYIVMAYIDGGSLAQRIQEEGPLPLDETVRLLEQIADGLDYAHDQGVVHRDFKPSNILIDKRGNAYLADFGIAKVSQETAQLTGSGIVGTPSYMAPEMFQSGLVTPAIDIYALGVTLYQMLSGEVPYSGSTPVQLMYAHLNEPIPDIRKIREDASDAIQSVIEGAMAKEPAERFQRAEDVAKALREAVEPGEVSVEPVRGAPSAPPPVRTQAAPAPAAAPPAPRPAEAAPAAPAPEATEAIEPVKAAKKPTWWRINWRVLVAIGVALAMYFLALVVVLSTAGLL